jgi:hypothetical protein
MLTIFLQIWGGLFYTINKVFFSQAERSKTPDNKRKWQIRSWAVYLIGVPAWVTLFIMEHDWIAAAIETGVIPAMIMGLVIAWRGGGGKQPKILDYIARGFIVVGTVLSFQDAGGLNSVTQFLEIGIALAFLVGTYLLARNNAQGYLWIFSGNFVCATLMYMQDLHILAFQQIFSVFFIFDAYRTQRKRKEALAANVVLK